MFMNKTVWRTSPLTTPKHWFVQRVWNLVCHS